MKITGIETINLKEFRNVTWVRVHTDAGSFGLGETFYGTESVCGFIHETLAHELIGRDPTQIDAISRLMLNPICGFNSTGAEMRAASAIDIALWDLAGKTLGVPVHQLLGGKSREKNPRLQHLRWLPVCERQTGQHHRRLEHRVCF